MKGRNETRLNKGTPHECVISPSEREVLLNLDYNSFDQSLPNGGWRRYDHCPKLARELLDEYTTRHESSLQKQQWDVLVWHSGQISAIAGDYLDAISKMERTFKPDEKPTDAFLWNPYASATIAFLRRDKTLLHSEREKLARGLSPFNRINLRKVDSFVRCFDSSYFDAYSGNCSPLESNIERIRTLAVPFSINKPLPTDFFGLSDFLKMKKVILLGEIHGTKEVPELFGNLIASIADKQSKTLVILEINQSSQKSIDLFLRTLNESVLRKDSFFNRPDQDGRSSRAMVGLLRRIAKLPNTTVLCMDPVDSSVVSAQDRDSAMAAFINSKRVGFDRTLVLSGNIHSSSKLGTPWDKDFRPMGHELKNLAKDLGKNEFLNILVRYGKVDSWNCQGNDLSGCKLYSGKEIQTDYSIAVPYNSYFVWENQIIDGHNGSIFIRSVKASLPLLHKQ